MALDINVIDSRKLLAFSQLRIPPYQRPYSWTEDQLSPLLDDLSQKRDGPMIMGGIILHKDGTNELNIVDGQQRLITFSIIHSLYLGNSDICLLNHQFHHSQSTENIATNIRFVSHYINKRKKELYLNNIHFIVVTTDDREDAFSFFDSQNTRGKKLAAYDILKAHHLRYIENNGLATLCAREWETIEKDPSPGMSVLLETLLARGRKWSNRHNTEPDIREEFRSQRTTKMSGNEYLLNNYQQGVLFSSWKYDPMHKNSLEYRFLPIDATYKIGGIEVGKDPLKYLPIQIDQTIEGGEVFFWYIQKYYLLIKELFSNDNQSTSSEFKAFNKRLCELNTNSGTSYTYDLYRGTLLFYVDKFGYQNFDTVAAELFYLVYWLRVRQTRISILSVYKYIREINPFALIKEASFAEFIVKQSAAFLEDKYIDYDNNGNILKRLEREILKNPDSTLISNHTVFKRQNSQNGE